MVLARGRGIPAALGWFRAACGLPLRALLAELGAQDEEDGARAQAGSCFLTLPGESPARPRATSPVEFV